MIKRLSLALAALVLFTSCTKNAPSTQVSNDSGSVGGPGEMLRDKDSAAGYGAESYRLISQPDEIVSVLKNGLVVVTKRIPSPVASIRAYCFTGGVYEGKWLGGGLSHLLEHLLAGGTNERRTPGEDRNPLQGLGDN